MSSDLDKDIARKLLKLLEEDPNLSQRKMARKTGASLGKVNYCLTRLVKEGFVKVKRSKNAVNKQRYSYCVTTKGLSEKADLTCRFLRKKLTEYDEIKRQIKELSRDVEKDDLRRIL